MCVCMPIKLAAGFRSIRLEFVVESGDCHVQTVSLTHCEAWRGLREKAWHRQHIVSCKSVAGNMNL